MRVGKGLIYFLTILLLGSIVLGSGCTDNGSGEGRAVRSGDTVKVDYVGKLENGMVFDTSIKETAEKEGIYVQERNYIPLTFTVGAGQMISGFDEAVIGMRVGEEKTVTLPPEEAYGEYDEAQVQAVPLEELNMSEKPEVGQVYSSIYGSQFRVIAVNETHVTFDANHELAGKTLVFDIKLVSIE
ncbi:Peptidyl-prolyl cis-trans isomerase [Methanosarcina horonobensis HB-1 = JCM 15518]|uniref:Peptidyl-prolyl cis-trans isomerase n=2 Tax=Methanosarcina horonobensis TaxID=418008 RepID=A0A0E3SA07_9EURY|nr:peptidylprolyl isomerase [Methanosarcina horonobensis]AKB77591.1 Peptidyl-prolyl cis-trans isomerase [Methanosarcina horonobensis HB-1 = JCM 15518]